jgi:hypothetical protein
MKLPVEMLTPTKTHTLADFSTALHRPASAGQPYRGYRDFASPASSSARINFENKDEMTHKWGIQ